MVDKSKNSYYPEKMVNQFCLGKAYYYYELNDIAEYINA